MVATEPGLKIASGLRMLFPASSSKGPSPPKGVAIT